MFFPRMKPPRQSRVTISRFLGYDRRERIETGSFAKMKNLTGRGFPTMTVRPRRGLVAKLAQPGALAVKEALLWVDGTTLYMNGKAIGPMLAKGEKQLVSMGAFLIIWPDKVWINTRDVTEFGSLENTVTTQGTVHYSLCRADGTAFTGYAPSEQPPKEPKNGALWLDISAQTPVLRQYTQDGWMPVENVCVKISAGGIGKGFAEGDGVEITGCGLTQLNGQKVLQHVEESALVIGGILAGDTSQAEKITLRRVVPDMDFVVECGNRLWGCKYGIVNGQAVNAIYASKLGDFKNWTCYAGLSTDSYAVTRGSDGPFTGAAAYLGSPIFFKEQCMERVYPSAAGAHQVVNVACAGVKRGSHKSIVTVDGTLYYHGPGGVYAFDGSMPAAVSRSLGQLDLRQSAAGNLEGRYYLSGCDEGGQWQLLVYDTQLHLWFREDETHALFFARHGEELFCLTAAGELWAMLGSEGQLENSVQWEAESGDLGLDTAQNKYPTKLTLRLELPEGSEVQALLSCDGGRTWTKQGTVRGQDGPRGCLLHLRPQRAGQVRLRLQGTGRCTLYSISAVYEKGSDGP